LSPSLLRRIFLAAVACESLVAGLWLELVPTGLFNLLEVPPRDLVLVKALGLLFLAHVPCLLLAAYQPATFRSLALVPLLGRVFLACLWAWLLTSDRISPAQHVLVGLLILALAWLPGLAWTLRHPRQDETAEPDDDEVPYAEKASTP
jgi:hypothetical protein